VDTDGRYYSGWASIINGIGTALGIFGRIMGGAIEMLRRHQAKVLLGLLTLVLAYHAIHGVLQTVKHPGATLDDSFIHYQYARAIAAGHPFRYQAGEPISTGSTSLLWPAVLAPFYLIGFRDLSIMWPAWALSFACLALLAQEAYRLARPLSGEGPAVAAGGMVLAFGGLLWCAASGMEVVPFAWTLARTVRLASEWSEGQRDRRAGRELTLFAWLSYLFRPEGALFALMAGAVMIARPAKATWKSRALGLLPLVVPALVPLAFRLASGSAMSTTAQVKLLYGNPYYVGDAYVTAVRYNLGVFFESLLNGRVWSAEFVPGGGAWVALAGLGSVLAMGVRTGRSWRAVMIVVLAAAMLIPCTYVTFLWNRLRYLWPFVSGWLVGLSCFARLLGDGLARLRPRFQLASPIVAGTFVGMLASHLPGTLDDIANSASGIDRQQVKLGRWAKDNLPADARIGVNDTGAIAYFSDRKTFDIVGLTTASEGRYWVAGPGSRFEHYERLHKTEPTRLPTHFIVYAEWMACEAVLGPVLTEAVVLDSTVLATGTMRAYSADYTRLGSGELPWTRFSGEVTDTLDVADLESEREHAYDLAGAREGENVAQLGTAPDGREVADGGRTHRRVERFTARLKPKARVIVRLESHTNNVVHVRAGGRELPPIALPANEAWFEQEFDVPAEASGERTAFEITADAPLSVYGYWFVTRSASE
jgi:hypothetical protein